MKRTPLIVKAGVAAAMLFTALGCGAPLAPSAKSVGQAPFQARAGWSHVPLELGNQWGWDFDRPREGHPFAYPVDFRVRTRDGRSAVEMLARNVQQPVRGFAVIPVNDRDDAGSFYNDDQELAKKIRLKFRWANNTADGTKETALPAMVVFLVNYWTGETQDDEEVLKTVGIGYAWATRGVTQASAVKPDQPETLVKGFMYPPPPGNNQGMAHKPPMTIAAEDSHGVPFRFIVSEIGYGDNKPCGDEAFQGMTLKEVTIDNLVKDVHMAFPETRPRPKLVDGGEQPTAPITVPEENERLRGISAVAFGANVPANVCSHATLLDTIELQRVMK